MKRLLLSFKVLLATMLLFAGGNAWAAEVTLTYSEQGYENAASLDGVAITLGDVTFQLDNATASNPPLYYTKGASARVYPGATLTVSSAAGNITAITLNAVQGKSGNTTTLTADAGSLEDLAWTGDASSVVFTAAGSGHLRITSITVTTSEAAAAVKTPVASLGNGTYFGTQSVELTCETEGATIYYTTDGTEPTAESTAYTAAIEISETTTLKAIAISGEDKSSVLTRTYTIGASYANIAALVAGAQSGDVAQLTLTDAVVAYANGSDVYVQDATGAVEFYGIKIDDASLVAGNVLNGTALVTYKLFNNLPEITALEGDVTVTAGEAPAATAMSVADALKAENLCKYITISSATVADGSIVSGTDTLAIYDRWKTGAAPSEGLYDQITGVVSVYKTTTQLNFISADTTKLASVEEGTYYLYNPASGKYLVGGNSWGTQASINADGLDVTLARLADGKYSIATRLAGRYLGYNDGLFMDNGTAFHCGFYAVEGAENTYYISLDDRGYLAYDGSTTVLITSEEQNENAQWVLVTKEDRLAELATATQDAPVSATFLIDDPNFDRNNDRSASWIHTNHTNFNISGGNNTNNCAESWRSTFDLSQKVGLPAGVYSMTAQGFYVDYEGNIGENVPFFFIGDSTAQFPARVNGEDNMSKASAAFTNGDYTIDPIYIEVTDSILIGAKNTYSAGWCIWDNFQLTYYGKDANIEQLKNAALYEQLASLLEEAKTLAADETLHATKAEALATAIAAGEDAQEGSDLEAVSAAIEALTAANADAAAYQKAGDVLAQMKKLTESTNFYTEEALNEYYTQWQAKYDDGTLTEEEASGLQNPYTQTGWHDALTCDNFLMSAWDQPADFHGFYYINTWSVEGNTDGSEFKTPFFEYWTGDAGTLGANTLSATVSNLAPGEYTVEAVVRVRLSDSASGATPSGITMQANDGTAVSVCDGTAYGQLYVDTVTVACTVGEDSTLTVKFNVEEGTNVSWLSFQNVKYIAPATELEIPVSVERTAGLGYSDQTVDIDFTEALAFLGISSVSEATPVAINMTDGTVIENAMTVIPDGAAYAYDGWFNKDGDCAIWGDNTSVCVKFLPDNAQFNICDMGNDNVPAAGESFTCKWGLQANGKTAIFVVTVDFVEPAPAQYSKLSELEVLETVSVNHEMETGQGAYTQTTNSFDAAAIATALGLENLEGAQVYWLSVTDSSLVQPAYGGGTVDGWRDANGDPLGYGYEGGVCVKIQDPASGTIDNICDYGTGTAGTVIHAPYVFANDNGQAVIVDVVITYVDPAPVGIQSLTNGQSLQNATIYTLGGQRVSNVSKGGIYIVNGKKVLVK